MQDKTVTTDRKMAHTVIFSSDRKQLLASAIHYPEHWDTATYPTLAEAIYEIVTNAGCSECPKKQ